MTPVSSWLPRPTPKSLTGLVKALLFTKKKELPLGSGEGPDSSQRQGAQWAPREVCFSGYTFSILPPSLPTIYCHLVYSPKPPTIIHPNHHSMTAMSVSRKSPLHQLTGCLSSDQMASQPAMAQERMVTPATGAMDPKEGRVSVDGNMVGPSNDWCL